FLDIYIKNAKTELFVKYQLASKIEEPTEKELKAYYDSKKIKDPYNKVKAELSSQYKAEMIKYKVAAYTEKIKNERQIEINDAFFEAPKDKKNEEVKK
ncbi:MAG TPA: hypothetical protein DHW82_03300, partial [Spirochaetia bacterium]|nr:hypothetical protein [Spirochaetia bacterium]